MPRTNVRAIHAIVAEQQIGDSREWWRTVDDEVRDTVRTHVPALEHQAR